MVPCTPRGLGQDPVVGCDKPAEVKVSMGITGGTLHWCVCADHYNEICNKFQDFRATDPVGADKALSRFKVVDYGEVS